MAIADSATANLASDKALRPFLAPAFDPVDFLNATLPSWTPSRQNNPDAVSLADLTAKTQTLLSQLNAQLTRLTSNLTSMTDDILRTGGRLAYEVEMLKADSSSLSDALTQGLADDIKRFTASNVQSNAQSTPDYITRLHSLAVVRERLDSVIKVFGAAIDWPLPPSEVSLRSSIVTFNAPDGQSTDEELEKKGHEYAERIRNEIIDTMGEGSLAEFDAALKRIDILRDLASVWKGTSEEKARMKLVEALSKMVEDKRRSQDAAHGYRISSDMVYGSHRR